MRKTDLWQKAFSATAAIVIVLSPPLTLKPGAAVARAAEKADLPFVNYQKWSRFTERAQEIYVQSLLETWSFVLYGMTAPQKSSGEFSAFTRCVEKERLSDFRTYLINYPYGRGDTDKPPVVLLFNNTPILCGKFADKGTGSLRPVKLVKKEDWEKFSAGERTIYLMGYVDFVYFSGQRILALRSREQSSPDQATARFLEQKKNDLQRLETCLGQAGIEGLSNTISRQPIEWKTPLPWSVAKALGKTCS